MFNAIAFLPVLFVFDKIGFEKLELPNRKEVILLTLNGFIGNFFFDYCYMRSVILLGPLITQLGLTLTFPISLLLEILFY